MHNSALINDLQWRGILKQCSDVEGISHCLQTTQCIYAGFDPTADSLHIGNLLPLLALRRVQIHGHRPIAILGGGTGLIGDPSGKASERQLNTPEIVDEWVSKIEKQICTVLDPTWAIIENNKSWITPLSAVELLRDIGKNFTVSFMLAKESVSSRLEAGISFTEFTYMILQAYDFLTMRDRHGCRIQIGGSDQWGNMTAGIDLIRRVRSESTFAMTFPLLTTASGRKFGKTEGGAVWLDPRKTTPYAFYQFWMTLEDEDVERFMKYFTLLSQEEIADVVDAHKRTPESREGHRRLAAEVTRLVHGQDELDKVLLASKALFGGDDLSQVDVTTLLEATASAPQATADLLNLPSIQTIMVDLGLASSKSDASRLLKSGGVYCNNRQVDTNFIFDTSHFLEGRVCILRKGKKNYATIRAGS